jgi:DNA-binding response OmpR family regulator
MAKILIVEDDKLLARAIRGELEEGGYAVQVTASGDTAADLLNKEPFDLVFLDIMLQGDYDGYDVLQALRDPKSNYRKVPVIILSNMGQMENMDKAMDMGATDYVVKASTDMSKIVELANKHLKVHGGREIMGK